MWRMTASGKLTDGACCAATKAGARHSRETLSQLAEAHDHLVAAGAKCDAGGFAAEEEVARDGVRARQGRGGKLAKMLAGERAEKAALIATLTDIVPRLDQLTKRVEDIARTPLPPLAIAKSVTAISKQQDAGVAEAHLPRRARRRVFSNEQGRADPDPDQGELRPPDPPARPRSLSRRCAANRIRP